MASKDSGFSIVGDISGRSVKFNDLLEAPSLKYNPGDPTYDAMSTCIVLMLQVMRHHIDFPRQFISKMNTVFRAARSSYVVEILLLALINGDIPGPLVLAERLGITKQAVSKEIIDAVDRVEQVDPNMA